MIAEEWKRKIRNEHLGYTEEEIEHYGTDLIVWFYVETGGRDENFPPYISHAIIRNTDGTTPDLEDWEWDEALDKAFKQRTSASEHG